MAEQFKREKGPTPENLEDKKHRELQEAMEEEDRIMQEIDNVLNSTPDRAEAEKIVLEKWAPLMDEAMIKSGEALKSWLDTMREAGERERKKLDDMKKDLDKEWFATPFLKSFSVFSVALSTLISTFFMRSSSSLILLFNSIFVSLI